MDVAGRGLVRSSADSPSPQQEPSPLLPQVQNGAAAAVEALAEGRSVVISGAAGTGKSTLMARILADLGGGFSVLRLRGAAAWSGKPFGGLFWLLSELPPESLANPVYVLQFIRRVLGEKAAGRRLVLAIENAEDLDMSTIAVLLQLCRTGHTLMLATVRDPAACPEEFIRWWAEGTVHREDLGTLHTGETRTLLEGLCGGPVSSRLVVEVQERTRGNPMLATLFFQEQMAAGAVVRRRGTWVWTGAVSYAGALSERVETETRGLSPDERYAVDALALTGGLPVQMALRVTDAAAVERLEEMFLVAADPGTAGILRLKDPVLTGAAAALVPHGRAQEIRSRLAGAAVAGQVRGGTGPTPEETAARAAVREARDLARNGRWGEAADAAQAGLALLAAVSGPHRGLFAELFCVFLRCGELRLAGHLLARTEAGTDGVELPGGNDLCAGLVHVLGGRADRALEYLQRALAQLEESRSAELIPLARAAAAYACVLLGDPEAARGYLAAPVTAPGPSASGTGESAAPDQRGQDSAEGITRCLLRLCSVRGVPAEGGGSEAGSEVEPALRLPVLAAAALRGVPGAAGKLEDGAAGCTGAAAAMYADLAAGLADADSTRMLRAAESAHSLGQYLLAHESAGHAVRLARSQGDRTALRAARRIENASFRMLLAANSVPDRLPDLSEFERGLALGAAAGESSSHLAARLHLSPRTVDWHLGRIFSKLRVSGRAELRECLEAARPER